LSEALPVDKDGGGAPDSDPAPFPEIAVDKGGDLLAAAVLGETVHVQTQIPGELIEKFIAQLVVIFKNPVMVFPELSLFAGGQGGLGCRLCQLVVLEGEVLEDQSDFLGVFLEHLLEEGDKPRAVRSLEIIEDGDGHRSASRSLEG
jgi:hypothetical protein